ncbi:hypothetical protein R8Z50_10720 [Longispora sp. K20-0274]|uniref:hypothetical protein n=1 Tax=Longispora sp. K20-0274 TaxID=3088255 RepID=UPI00399A6F28
MPKLMIADRRGSEAGTVGWMVDGNGIQEVPAILPEADERGTVIVIDPGTGGPITVITSHGSTVTVEHHPIIEGDPAADTLRVVNVIRAAARIKTPGLTTRTVEALTGYLLQETAARYPDAGLVIFS